MRLFVGIVMLLAVACGGDDGGGGPSNTVDGGWDLTVSVESGEGTCGLDDAPLLLNQEEDGDITGTYGPAIISCAGPGGTVSEQTQGTIVGEINGDDVEFTFDGEEALSHQGTLDGDAMEGTATWTVEGITLTGDWNATRD